ncbi:SRPBCC family protein [Cetobacterium sp.]
MESIVIEAPKELIFSVIEDGEIQNEWMEGFKEGRVISKTNDLVGTEFEEIIEVDKRRHVFHGRILAYEKDEKIKVSLDEDDFEIKIEYDVERLEKNKTLLILKCWLLNTLKPKLVVEYYMNSRLEKQLQRIKTTAESKVKK